MALFLIIFGQKMTTHILPQVEKKKIRIGIIHKKPCQNHSPNQPLDVKATLRHPQIDAEKINLRQRVCEHKTCPALFQNNSFGFFSPSIMQNLSWSSYLIELLFKGLISSSSSSACLPSSTNIVFLTSRRRNKNDNIAPNNANHTTKSLIMH